ncbi:hypothetical protein Tco_0666965 [Tanacetum coccineum]
MGYGIDDLGMEYQQEQNPLGQDLDYESEFETTGGWSSSVLPLLAEASCPLSLGVMINAFGPGWFGPCVSEGRRENQEVICFEDHRRSDNRN